MSRDIVDMNFEAFSSLQDSEDPFKAWLLDFQ